MGDLNAFLKISRGFFISADPPIGHFAVFRKENDKCPEMGLAPLEMTEPLRDHKMVMLSL